MKIEHTIEKLEDKYFDLQLTFKTLELESKINFALIDNNIEQFITFVNKIHVSFINEDNIQFETLSILDADDRIIISYIKDTLKITYNLVYFNFKDIAKILLVFLEISEYLEKNR